MFKQRLHDAELVLTDGKQFSADNPHWYRVELVLARGQGWERPRVKALFEEAFALEPLYLHLYSSMARYLTPRWYGEDGDWEQFAEEMARRVGGREGSIIYGDIALNISLMYRADQFFAQNHVSWPRLKQAFLDREFEYGLDVRTLNVFGLLAASAGDKAKAREIFERLGEAWNPEIWKERHYFDSYRKWALSN